MSTSSPEVEYPLASDGEALQSLFSKHCNEGLMTEEDLRNVPAIKDMLEQGDLLSSELTEIWKAAPKFPQVDESSTADKIDVDSFIQVYRDIDDLFEDDGEEEIDEKKKEVVGVDESVVAEEAEVTEEDVAAAAESVSDEDEDAELKQTFATLGSGESISFSQLRQWDEISTMIEEDGTLGEDELVTLWENALGGGAKGTEGDMDLEGFIKFNNALDDLFEFEDEEEEEGVSEEEAAGEEEDDAPAQPAAPRPIITEEDLPPGVLFSQLADENYLVGKEDLQRWGELNDMLKEGDLTMDELDALFNAAAKAPGTKDMLGEEGFCDLYDAIDNLFEDVDDNDEEEIVAEPQAPSRELKEELLEAIEDIVQLAEEEGQQICGLDCSEMEQERVLEIVSELEREPYNQVVALSATGAGAVDKEELVGTWDLIYSSSSTMKYNEGLSGLAGGLTRFGGLQQKLSATKYLSDVEYTEQVVGKLGGQENEIKITGDWDLRTEVSLFTGKPSNVLSVVPDKVTYGPRSDKADHWKSLGPMNMLVLSYLDEDLRIMRGNTSTDTLFILRRSK
eukprot:CAMPEP_0183710162 /NCGR_PEP_ID=MMETSP0737-20130205/5981_1 /TAXON_ID=385413 /ORGANISM="Thalassiosira miniscula, Strain CCMP1093" /LENGTH=563 /DNA_ID=CAMNT_0025938385 /DNA_START=366 /DNA_END=2057 /DNA_ORIENTATION=-